MRQTFSGRFDSGGLAMRLAIICAAALASAGPAAAAIAWGGPGWYVMAFDEGGWHVGLRGQYAVLGDCRAQQDRLEASNSDPEIGFGCVYLPSPPTPDPYHPSAYVSLPADAKVDAPPLRLHD